MLFQRTASSILWTTSAYVIFVYFNQSIAEDYQTCFDRDDSNVCRFRAENGYCFQNPAVVSNCRRTCRACDEFGCRNQISIVMCDQNTNNCFNSSAADNMTANCQQSCGICAYNPRNSSMPSYPSISNQDLFVSNETHVLKISNNGSYAIVTTVIVQDGGNIVGVAADIQRNFMFWANNGLQWKGIYRCNFDGSNVRRIVSQDMIEVNGIGIDDLSKHVYWTDAQRRRVEMTDYDGNMRKVISYTDLVDPRGIAVDAINGFLYWNDQGSRRIFQSQLDGRVRESIVQLSVNRPNQMALGTLLNTSKLYWVEACDDRNETNCFQSLKSVNRNNITEIRTEFNLSKIIGSKIVFGLAISGEWAYVSVWEDCKILEINLLTLKWRMIVTNIGSNVLFSLALAASASTAPNDTQLNACFQSGNGGCSHLCIPLGGSDFRCTCPTFGALVLAGDGKVCNVATELLIYCDAFYGQIGFVHLSSDDLHLIAYSSRPIGVAYDPINQTVYWSDVKDRNIYRVPVDGSTVRENFLAAAQGIGIVDGLAVDWSNRMLYFANQDSVTVEGAAYSWHRIEVIGLDGNGRRNLISRVEQPRALAIDSAGGFLYYTDCGSEAEIARSNLDGSGLESVLSGLENPNGAVIQGPIVYVIDSRYKTKVKDNGTFPVLYGIDVSAKDTVKLTRNFTELSMPYGIAAKGTSTLFLSDWNNGMIISYDTTSGAITTLKNSSEFGQTASILFTPYSTTLDGKRDDCELANCSDICLQSANKLFVCSCPSDRMNVLREDSRTCIEPNNYLLIADMNSVDMIGLDYGGDRSVYQLVSGQFFNDFTAIAFDVTNETLYYSDSNSRVIYRKVLSQQSSSNDPSTPQIVFYDPGHVIEDMAIDTNNGYLYWTASDVNLVARLAIHEANLTTEVIVSNTTQPRAIAIDSRRPGFQFIYWTTIGVDSGLWRSSLDGSGIRQLTGGIGSPNGLYLDVENEQIYVLDGINGSMHQCSLVKNETACRFVRILPGVGPFFGILLYEDLVYYSDWGSKSVYMYDSRRRDHQDMTVASNLMRPTKLLLHHPKNITENCVGRQVSCQEICVAYPGGYYCDCRDNFTLTTDEHGCQRNSGLPPRLLYCPKDWTVVTKSTKAVVWWRDPVFVFTDNRTSIVCTSNPGDQFSIGNTTVSCTASTGDQLKTTCSFNVTVIQIGFACDDPPSPINGRLVCNSVNGGYYCQVFCDEGFGALHNDYTQKHECQEKTWNPPFLNPAICQKLQGPSQEMRISITFFGQCPHNDSQFDSDFRNTFAQELYRFALCDSSEIADFCNPANYEPTAVCPRTRQARQAQANQDNATLSILPWVSASDNQSVTDKIETLNTVTSNSKLEVNFRGYHFVASQLRVMLIQSSSCPTNWMNITDNLCGECPSGTFFLVSKQSCVFCESGTYQSQSSQVSCIPCPVGKTSPTGSFNLKQCFDSQPQQIPSSNDDRTNLPLIIGLCVGLGGGLLIIAIILLVILLRRKNRQNGAEMRSGGNTNPRDKRDTSTGKHSTYLAWPEDDDDPRSQPVQLALRRPIDQDMQPGQAPMSTFLGNESTDTEQRRLSSGEPVLVIPVPSRLRPSKSNGRERSSSYALHQRVDRPRDPASSLGVYRGNGKRNPDDARTSDDGNAPTLQARPKSDERKNGTDWRHSSTGQTTV